MELRSKRGYRAPELISETLYVPVISSSEPNSFTITGLNNGDETLNQKGGFQVEDALNNGLQSVQESDPVTPLPFSLDGFSSIAATSELDPASGAGNSDEAGLQRPTSMAIVTIESPTKSKRRTKQRRGVRGSSLKLGKVEEADRPDWLPAGWDMERKARQNGSSAGMVESFYYEPVKGRKFRSKSEVLEFLVTGTPRRRKRKPKGNNGLDNVMVNSETIELPSNESVPQTPNVMTGTWPEPESLTAIDIKNEANNEGKVQDEESPVDGSVRNLQPQPPRRRGVKGTRLKLGKIAAPDLPEWLPHGWEMERKAREAGRAAGMIDTFYTEPTKGLKFRSKTEVLFYLETGTRQKRKTKEKDRNDLSNVAPLNNSASSEQNGSTSKRKKTTASKGTNPRKMVEWVLNMDADGSGSLIPVTGDEMVPKDWDSAFTLAEVGASCSRVDAE